MAAAVWWVNSFVGPNAAGNATGVVLLEDAWDNAQCARVARALRAPDTVFVLRDGAGYSARFFSPHEGEMTFCGQGLIAADAVLRELGAVPIGAEVTLQTSVGPVRTAYGADAKLTWCSVPKSFIRPVASNASVRSLLPLSDPNQPERVVDSGRKRLFKQVTEIDAISLDPAQVVDFCQRHELSGVCFYARVNATTLRLRVFTVSLAGNEDASTGGAVLGLSALLPDLDAPVEILQGVGSHALNRGRLLLRIDNHETCFGGLVELIAQGSLR